MRDLKQTAFTDRLATQAEAKKALLARFKPKAAVPDPEFDKLAEKRAAERAAIKAQREAAIVGGGVHVASARGTTPGLPDSCKQRTPTRRP